MELKNLSPELLEALDKAVELLDEAAILIRAGHALEADQKIQEARHAVHVIRIESRGTA